MTSLKSRLLEPRPLPWMMVASSKAGSVGKIRERLKSKIRLLGPRPMTWLLEPRPSPVASSSTMASKKASSMIHAEGARAPVRPRGRYSHAGSRETSGKRAAASSF